MSRVLSGMADQSVRFQDIRGLLLALGFAERVRGSHHIYTRADVEEILNLQPAGSGQAKLYQVRQVRQLIVKYKLAEERTRMNDAPLRYEVIIYWSQDDGAFIAEVPELPWMRPTDRRHRKRWQRCRSWRQWIETARDLGRAVPEPKGRLVFA